MMMTMMHFVWPCYLYLDTRDIPEVCVLFCKVCEKGKLSFWD